MAGFVCVKCGYELMLPAPGQAVVCPECGPSELEASEKWDERLRRRYRIWCYRWAWYPALAGPILMLMASVFGGQRPRGVWSSVVECAMWIDLFALAMAVLQPPIRAALTGRRNLGVRTFGELSTLVFVTVAANLGVVVLMSLCPPSLG